MLFRTQILSVTALLVAAAVAPAQNGNGKIVFAAQLNPGAPYEVYTINSDGTGMVSLTANMSGESYFPRISPDGSKIAFDHGPGSGEVWWMNADGTFQTQLAVLASQYGPSFADWLDDNAVRYYHGPSAGVGELHAISLDNSGERLFWAGGTLPGAVNPSCNGRVSPDGTMSADFFQGGSWAPTFDLYLADLVGGVANNPRPLYEDTVDDYSDQYAAWSPDSQTVYWTHFEDPGVGPVNSVVVRKDVTSTVGVHAWDAIVVPNQGYTVYILDVSDDGNTLLLLGKVAPGTQDDLMLFDIATGALTTLVTATSISGGDWGVDWSLSLTVDQLIADEYSTFEVGNAVPGNNVLIGYSLTGGGPLSTQYGPASLSAPIQQLTMLPADVTGSVAYTALVPPVPGISIWFQALDMGTLTFSNNLAMTVQ